LSDVSTEVPEDIRLQAVPAGEHFEGKSDEAKIRAAMAASRAERGERPRDEIKVWEGEAIPETGPHQSPHSAAGRATDYMRNMREAEVAESLKTRDGYLRALKEHPDLVWTATVENGSEDDVAAEIVKGKTGPEIINSIRDGQVMRPLLDHVKPWKLDDANLFENVQDAARSMKEFRDAHERAERAIVEQLDENLAAQALEQQQAAAPASPAPQPAPPPQQPAIEAERAQIAAERQALAQLHSRSIEERERIHEAVQIRQWIDQNYPPQVRTPEGFAELERINPGHAQYLRQWIPAAVQRDAEIRNALTQAETIRSAQTVQTEKVQRQQREQWAKGERGKFMDQLQKDYPHIREGTDAYRKLNAATAEVLSSDPELRKDYDNFGASRSATGLRMIVARAMEKIGQANQRNIASKRVHSHQPQVPGVHRPAGSDYEDEIKAVQEKLATASGNAALKLATRLTQLNRLRAR
jgi:hypothetical protein